MPIWIHFQMGSFLCPFPTKTPTNLQLRLAGEILYYAFMEIFCMTFEEKRQVAELQRQGHGYKKIALITGLPLNTVKSYCYRNPVVADGPRCRQCGRAIRQLPRTREKHFCSDHCRLTWWNTHPEQVHRTTTTHTCQQCGSSFESHIAKQLYCSRACYADARRKAVACNG